MQLASSVALCSVQGWGGGGGGLGADNVYANSVSFFARAGVILRKRSKRKGTKRCRNIF